MFKEAVIEINVEKDEEKEELKQKKKKKKKNFFLVLLDVPAHRKSVSKGHSGSISRASTLRYKL